METNEADPLAEVRAAYVRWAERGEEQVDEFLEHVLREWHMSRAELACAVQTLGAKSPIIALTWMASTMGALKTPTGRLLIMLAANRAARIERREHEAEPKPTGRGH